jgi:penicillin-binding protein 1A
MPNNQKYHRIPDPEKKRRIHTEKSAKEADEKAEIKQARQNSRGNGRGKGKKLTLGKRVGYVFSVIGTTFLTLFLIAVITTCVVAVALTVYVTQFAESMYDVDITNIELSYSSFVYAYCKEAEDYVELFALSADENRIWVDLADIPQHTLDALVATEDKRFFEHEGVDWTRTVAIGLREMLGTTENVQGGSTLTQQLVRDITKDNDVNIGRKLREIFRSLSLEEKYSKLDIMESYLNRVAFGNTIYGVGSAARHYFDKEVGELTIAESAILMGVLPSPVGFNPYANPRASRLRQEYSLNELFNLGFISYSQYREALDEQVQFRRPINPTCRCPLEDEDGNEIDRCDGTYFGYIDERWEEWYGLQNQEDDDDLYFENADMADLVSDPYRWRGDHTVTHNWYVDAALKEITRDIANLRDISTDSARTLVRRGGYRIYLSMDMEMQERLEQVFNDPLIIRSSRYPAGTPARDTMQGSFVIMNMHGDVVAVAGGVGDKPGNDAFNRAVQSPRNIGSTVKPPLIYAPAVDRDIITYSTMLMDAPGRIDDPLNPGQFKRWPNNFGGIGGGGALQTTRHALAASTNTVSARVLYMIGVREAYNFASDDLGIFSLDPSRHMDYSPISTGSMEIRLHELAGAYQIFGTGGVYYKPAFYSRVEDHQGNIVLAKDVAGTQAIGADSAWVINRAMHAVVHTPLGGTGQSANLNEFGIEVVGKTGTANDESDLLFAGLTPDYVGVLRIGFDDNRRIRSIGQDGWRPPTRIWRDVMARTVPTNQPRNFDALRESSGAVQLAYCTSTGLRHNPSRCGGGQLVGYYKAENQPPLCLCDGSQWNLTPGAREQNPLYRA